MVETVLECLRKATGGRPGVDYTEQEDQEPYVGTAINKNDNDNDDNNNDDYIDFSLNMQAESDTTTRRKATSYQPSKKSIVGEHLGKLKEKFCQGRKTIFI